MKNNRAGVKSLVMTKAVSLRCARCLRAGAHKVERPLARQNNGDEQDGVGLVALGVQSAPPRLIAFGSSCTSPRADGKVTLIPGGVGANDVGPPRGEEHQHAVRGRARRCARPRCASRGSWKKATAWIVTAKRVRLGITSGIVKWVAWKRSGGSANRCAPNSRCCAGW